MGVGAEPLSPLPPRPSASAQLATSPLTWIPQPAGPWTASQAARCRARKGKTASWLGGTARLVPDDPGRQNMSWSNISAEFEFFPNL
eukprot:gene10754-biopygen1390